MAAPCASARLRSTADWSSGVAKAANRIAAESSDTAAASMAAPSSTRRSRRDASVAAAPQGYIKAPELLLTIEPAGSSLLLAVRPK